MPSHNPTEVFVKLTRDEKLDFLLRLAHDLTIVGRDAYTVGGNGLDAPHRLREINEVEHRILAFCLALKQDNPKRYPDDVLLRIILEHPEDSELQRQILSSFDRVMALQAPAA